MSEKSCKAAASQFIRPDSQTGGGGGRPALPAAAGRLPRFVLVIVSLLCAAAAGCSASRAPAPSQTPSESDRVLARALERGESDLQVEGRGVVRRVLPDDTKGSRHQRFILALDSGQTVLVAHNIDLAPRVAGLREGDEVAFSGEYEWNEEGGVIHWTHRDPAKRHTPGWLRHKGVTYR